MIRETLTRRLGPLPVWMWGAGIGAGVIGIRWWRDRQAADEDPISPEATGETVLYSTDYLSGRDTAGWPPDRLPYDSAPPAPVEAPSWLYDPPSWLTDPPAWFGERPDPQPIQVVIAPPVDPTPAPAPAPTPAPVPAPTAPRSPTPTYPTPVPGTVIWKGAQEPNKTTINGLILSRYGRPVSWRIGMTRNAAGKVTEYRAILQ